jgi:phosphoribosylformylglycinamidine cyclo-ligase
MDYKTAGVDVEKGDLFVERIKGMIRETYDARVVSGVGGFAALYRMDDADAVLDDGSFEKLPDGKLLATGTDGVGTKVKLAQELGIHHTIGQDLVAMCVNDVLCTGARPLFFLDYLATGKLDLEVSEQIVRGIVNACKLSGSALIGGETAEMPGVYAPGVYDLAGFSVGEVTWGTLMDGSRCDAGQTILGLQASGFHSNGYSLVRKLLTDSDQDLKKRLLTPTRIYVKLIQALLKDQRDNITGLAHITGGGFHNIPRIQEKLGYHITTLPGDSWRPPEMNEIIIRSKLAPEQLYETFNMGIGFTLTVKDVTKAQAFLDQHGEKSIVLGQTTTTFEGLRLPG